MFSTCILMLPFHKCTFSVVMKEFLSSELKSLTDTEYFPLWWMKLFSFLETTCIAGKDDNSDELVTYFMESNSRSGQVPACVAKNFSRVLLSTSWFALVVFTQNSSVLFGKCGGVEGREDRQIFGVINSGITVKLKLGQYLSSQASKMISPAGEVWKQFPNRKYHVHKNKTLLIWWDHLH